MSAPTVSAVLAGGLLLAAAPAQAVDARAAAIQAQIKRGLDCERSVRC